MEQGIGSLNPGILFSFIHQYKKMSGVHGHKLRKVAHLVLLVLPTHTLCAASAFCQAIGSSMRAYASLRDHYLLSAAGTAYLSVIAFSAKKTPTARTASGPLSPSRPLYTAGYNRYAKPGEPTARVRQQRLRAHAVLRKRSSGGPYYFNQQKKIL
jgi:hypothetical protein